MTDHRSSPASTATSSSCRGPRRDVVPAEPGLAGPRPGRGRRDARTRCCCSRRASSSSTSARRARRRRRVVVRLRSRVRRGARRRAERGSDPREGRDRGRSADVAALRCAVRDAIELHATVLEPPARSRCASTGPAHRASTSLGAAGGDRRGRGASSSSAGAAEIAADAYEALRIEAGVPRQGFDIDETTIPQEAFLERDAVSFTKGCFLGQELVCRIDTRGHVNRLLRRLRADAPIAGARPWSPTARRSARSRARPATSALGDAAPRSRARQRRVVGRRRHARRRSRLRRRVAGRVQRGRRMPVTRHRRRASVTVTAANGVGASIGCRPSAAHRGGELAHDREPEAGADRAARRVADGVEPLEHRRSTSSARDAGTVVGHDDARRSSVALRRRDTSTVAVAYFNAFSTRLATIWPSRSGSSVGRERRRRLRRAASMPELARLRRERLGRVAHDLGRVARPRAAARTGGCRAARGRAGRARAVRAGAPRRR